MKKLILSVAILAVAASCSKNEVAEISSVANEISFSEINDRITKSANVSSDNYQIYAYTNLANETTWFMNAIVGGGSGETYSPTDGKTSVPYYWPEESATINFRGYCPDRISMGTASSVPATSADYDCFLTGGIGTIDAVSYADKTVAFTYNAGAGLKDLTLCDMVSTKDKTSGSVPLSFAHLLSAVTVDVKLSDAMTELNYAIANSSTSGSTTPYTIGLLMPRKRAIFSFGFDSDYDGEIVTSDTNIVTNNNGAVDAYTMSYPMDGDKYASTSPITYTSSASVLHYVIPQNLQLLATDLGATESDIAARVYVNDLEITYNGGAYYKGTTSVNLATALADACDISAFEAGTRYNITIIFDDGAPDIFDRRITFTSDNEAWTTCNIEITVGYSTSSSFVED